MSAKILLCRRACDEVRVRAFLSAKTQRSEESIDRHVADLLAWYSSTSEAERVQLAEPSAAPAAARAGAVVDKYMQEHHLHEWVTTQNLVKGITPTTPVVLQHLAGPAPPAAPAVGGRAPRRKRRSSLQFLRRWRGCWGSTWSHRQTRPRTRARDAGQGAPEWEAKMQKMVPCFASGAARV